jgi:nitrite reductase/ring-hydroxylating ferredoxin subunit
MYIDMTKVLVGKISEIAEGKLVHVTARGKEVLIANVGGKYYGMSDICNHAGAELHEGQLNGKELTCPWHGAKWDVTNGNLLRFPAKLKPEDSFKVSVENDTVYIEV